MSKTDRHLLCQKVRQRIQMSHWRHRVTEGAEFWISHKQIKLLRKAGCLQLIQNSASSCLVLLLTGPKMFWAGPSFCARPKIYLHIVAGTNILCQTKRWFEFSKIGFCASTKFFEEALLICGQIFWLAQNICICTKHFGTSKRTRHAVS